MDAATFFMWNRTADVLSPLLFKSLGASGGSSIIHVEMRRYEGAETIAVLTPEGIAVIRGYEDGWIHVYEGTSLLKGASGKKHLQDRTSVTIAFTEKGIRDIAALLYGYEESVG